MGRRNWAHSEFAAWKGGGGAEKKSDSEKKPKKVLPWVCFLSFFLFGFRGSNLLEPAAYVRCRPGRTPTHAPGRPARGGAAAPGRWAEDGGEHGTVHA